jgi:hypothetical protein
MGYSVALARDKLLVQEATKGDDAMGMSFMMLLILGGGLILFLAIVGGVVAMAMSGNSKDRDRDDRR